MCYPVLYLLDKDNQLLIVQPVRIFYIESNIKSSGERTRQNAIQLCIFNRPVEQTRHFSDMSFLCSLMKKNGVQIGENYNDNHGFKFKRLSASKFENIKQKCI